MEVAVSPVLVVALSRLCAASLTPATSWKDPTGCITGEDQLND